MPTLQETPEQQRLRQERERAAEALYRARGMDPGRAAVAGRAAAQLGLPPSIVRENEELLTQARVQREAAALSEAQQSIRWLGQPGNAEVAHDQVESLSAMERLYQTFSGPINVMLAVQGRSADTPAVIGDLGRQAFGGAITGTGTVMRGLGRTAEIASPLPSSSALGRMLANAGQRIELGGRNAAGQLTPEERASATRNLMPDSADMGLVTDVAGGLGQLGGQALMSLATGGTTTALPLLFGQGVGQMDERVEAEQEREGRQTYTGGDVAALMGGGAITALSEKLGLDAILGRMPRAVRERFTNAFADVLFAGAAEGTSEIVEGVGQNALAMTLLGEDTGLLDGTVEGGTVGALVGSISRAMILTAIPGRQYVRDTIRAESAEGSANNFDKLVESVAGSELLSRSAPHLRDFLSSIDASGTVYLPAEAAATFFQSSPENEALLDEWDLRDQYEQAMVSGADIAIPTATYLTQVAPSGAHEAWRDEVRHGLEAMSVKEAAAWKETGEAQLASDLADAATTAAKIATEGSPARRVYQDWLDQGRTAGLTRDVADANAVIMARLFERRAARNPAMFEDAWAAYKDANVSIARAFPESLRVERTDARLMTLYTALKGGKAAPSQKAIFGRSLAEFVSAEGGMFDTGGELAAMGAQDWHKAQRFRRKLVRADGEGNYGSDYVAERAIAAGYLPEGSTGNDLLEALREEMSGRPRFSANAERDLATEDNARALDDLEELLANAGLSAQTATYEEVKRAVDALADAPTTPPGVAYEQSMDQARALAQTYKAMAGIDKPDFVGPVHPVADDMKTIADALEAAKHAPKSAKVKRAYRALIDETIAQFLMMGDIKVEAWRGEGEPYANSKAMLADVRDNGHLWFFLTDQGFGPTLLNIGMNVSTDEGGGTLSMPEIEAALAEAGVTVVEQKVHPGEDEDTLVVRVKDPLSAEALNALSVRLRQDAVPQLTGNVGIMEGPRPEKFDGAFNPAYFKMMSGQSATEALNHPLLEPTGIKLDDGTELLANDLFRIVHDFFGHAQQGFNFGPVGELNAYLEHASMYSDEAVPALAAETLMQNAWVNFGPHLRREDGSLPAKGEYGFVPIPERRFADQKAFVATPEVLALAEKAKGEQQVLNQADGSDAPALQRPPVNPDGTITLTHYSVEPNLTETDPTQWGRSGNFLPREERNRISSHLPRTYFGIGVGLEGGYVPEFTDRAAYTTEVDASRLYDAASDPDGFRDNLDGVPPYDRINQIERQIEAAGYDGYWLKNVLGMTATVFKPLPVRPEAAAPAGRVLFQSATLRSGEETLEKFGLKPGKKYKTREVAAALEARQRKKWGTIQPNDRSDKTAKRIAGWMAEEIRFELQNEWSSGVGWYSTKFQAALDIFSQEFPELKTDRGARDLMTALIAITSDGQKVVPNFQQAAGIYRNFKATGRFTASQGTMRQDSVDGNLAKVQELYDTHGPAGMKPLLMEELTVSELKKKAQETGLQFSSSYPATTRLPLSALIFGPKLGAFYANLMGAEGYLTMDRWWSRTFNRYRGTLLQSATPQGLARFKGLVSEAKGLNEPADMMSDDQALAYTVEYRDSYAAKGYKGGTEIEKAANTLYKAAFENLEDQPFNAGDRGFMLKAVAEARAQLAKDGIDISIADIQAVLWYYEKRLYGELGARQTADISYEEAAQRVVEEAGASAAGRSNLPDAVAFERADPGTEVFAEPRVFNQSDDDVAPPFFSALERAVETSSLTKAPAAQWKATLAKTPGVKKEEIEWSGINDWLDLGTTDDEFEQIPFGQQARALAVDAKGNITREAVLGFLRAGGVRVDEVVLGEQRSAEEDAARAAAEDDGYDWEALSASQRARYFGDAVPSDGGAQFGTYKLPGADDTYREILLTLPNIDGPSTHWDTPNVVAHARITERTDASGARVLFLEEVQSDWHQKGRDQGYAADITDERRAEVASRVQAATAAYVEKVTEFVFAVSVRFDEVAEMYRGVAQKEVDMGMAASLEETVGNSLAEKHEREAARLRDLLVDKETPGAVNQAYRSVLMKWASADWVFGSKGGAGRETLIPLRQQADDANLTKNEAEQAFQDLGRGIPDAPFRTSWSALVMKRMIRYAADNGFEKVAWINGNQQNGGQTGGDGSFFYERNLVNVTNDLLKKYGARVEPVDMRSATSRRAVERADGEAVRRDILAHEELIGDDAAIARARERLDSYLAASETELARPATSLGIQNGFTITPALKAQAMSGFPLFQKGKAKGPRGQIDFSDPEKAAITLFSKADPTTPFHEAFGHLSLELLIRDAADPRSSPQTQQDLATVLGYLNVRDPRDIGRDQHELWASTAERYLFEGRAPSIELRDVMRRIKSWFVGVYRTVKHAQIDVPITDEIRSVMDRLLASEDEIVAAREQMKIEAGFTDAAAAGMTEEAFADYQRLVSRARDDADDELLRRTMRVIRQKRQEEWNAEADAIREEVVAEIDSQPDIRAVNWLRGSKVALNREIVIAMLGDEAGIKLLPKGVPPLVSKNGVHPDSVAEVAGYGSGMELLDGLMAHEEETQSLRAMKDKRSVRQMRIDREIEARVNEILGDPLTDGSVEAEAMAALHTGRQAEVLAIELGVLSRRVGNAPPPLAALRSWARAQIGSRPVREARSGKFLRAERSAANAVQKALAAGDRQEAARQKQAQVMNHLLYSEARHAEEFAARAVRRLGKLDQKRTMRSMDQEYLEQIHALLEQYDLRKVSGAQVQRHKSLMEFVNAQMLLGNEVYVPEELIDAASKQHYSDLTVDELRALDDTVRSLAHLGRLKQTLLDNRDRRDFEQVIDEMLGQVMDLKNRKGLEGRNPAPNDLRNFDAALWKMETLFDWLDKGEVNGVFNRVLLRPAVDAANRSDVLHETVGRALRVVYDAVPKAIKKTWLDKVIAPELIDLQTGQPSQFTRSDLIAMALNVGNASNLDKLARGEEWADADIMTVLNRELKAEEWVFVQGVWDGLEILWPDIAAAERALTGVEPERVDPQEVVTTTAGTLRGGYYPVKYDRSRDPNAARWAAAEAADLFSGGITGAATQKGHTISRTQYAGPILLSVEGVLFGHLNNVIARIAYGQYIPSALKFIRDPRVRAAVEQKVGPEYYEQLEPWLKAQVTDRARNDRDLEGFEKWVKKARMNFQMVAMGFRVSTGLAQIAGFAQSAAVVGNGRLAANIVRYAASIRAGRNDLSDFVFERSEELRQRMANRDRDARDMMRELIGKGGPLPAIQRAAFVHIGVMDQFVSVPTWMAAYEAALQNGAEEADAIALGDKAVRRTQGTGREYALASVQRPNSEFMKLFTLFYSYFSVQYNRQRDIARYATTGDPAKAISMTFWVMVMAPVMGSLLTGDWPDEDDGDDPLEKWVSWAARKVFFNLFSGVPVIRDVSSTVERKVAGEFSKYAVTPVTAVGEAFLKTGTDVSDLLTGEEVSEKWLKNTIQTTGYFVGLPTGQISSTAQYVKELFDGTQAPDNVGEFLYGLAKGPQESQES